MAGTPTAQLRPPEPVERVANDADTALVRRIVGGDRGALSSLYDRYSGFLMAIAVRILGDRSVAEDLLHDVFLEVWRAAATYDATRGSVRAWLAVRMRSRSIDRTRIAKKTETVPVEYLPERAHIESAEASADRIAVRRALAQLAPEQRQILELGYFGGLSATEIAAHQRLPVGTVKSRTASGLRRLRAALTESTT